MSTTALEAKIVLDAFHGSESYKVLPGIPGPEQPPRQHQRLVIPAVQRKVANTDPGGFARTGSRGLLGLCEGGGDIPHGPGCPTRRKLNNKIVNSIG